MSTLEELRKQIDDTDEQLVNLLNRRADLALQVKDTKKRDKISVYSPGRERQILDRVRSLAAQGSFPLAPLERIFVDIISSTRSLVGDLSVSYIGPEYSLAHDAAIKHFGEEVRFGPEVNIEDVFLKIERGDAHYGVIPARTSSTGLVTKTFDLLMQSDLLIIAEIGIAECLVLFGKATALSEVKRVYSDAYYFSRSSTWLTANLPSAELVLESNISAAVDHLQSQNDSALIASGACGEQHGLKALASGIETDLGVDSRFIVIGQKEPKATGRDKTSLLCAVEDRAGALRDVLRPFADRGITLLKIESRPLRNRAWEYLFFIDIVGHQNESLVKEAIGELESLSSHLKVLGSYPLVCHS